MSAIDSLGMLDAIGNNIIIHIPHGCTEIPQGVAYIKDIQHDIEIYTDIGVIDVFNTGDHTTIIYPYSRYFCDVERLINDPMESVGMGIYYTHNLKRDKIRDDTHKDVVINSCNEHHKILTELCQKHIDLYGSVIIIDAHSFGNDIVNNPNNIDICLGFNDDVCPHLKQYTVEYFKVHNYIVGVNDPYGGSIIPKGFEHDNRVQSVMIEINKSVINDDTLKHIVRTYINNVSMF
jgi:N-formylglutamate amidohydrolase